MPLLILIFAVLIAFGVILGPILLSRSVERRIDGSTVRIDTAVSDVRDAINRLLEAQERTTRRLENLETIVTSLEWDDLSAPERPKIALDDPEPSAEKEAERIARRVGN